MNPELSKKERTEQKRQAISHDMYLVFAHSYEMDRAWRTPQRKSFEKAINLFHTYVNQLMKQKPQDRALLTECRTQAKALIVKLVADLEGQVIKHV